MAANIMYRFGKVMSRRSRSKHLKGVVHPFKFFEFLHLTIIVTFSKFITISSSCCLKKNRFETKVDNGS